MVAFAAGASAVLPDALLRTLTERARLSDPACADAGHLWRPQRISERPFASAGARIKRIREHLPRRDS